MHRGDLGAANLNSWLQEALTVGAPVPVRGGRTFRPDDKVMQVRSDYDKEVWNGDIGRVERVQRAGQAPVVHFDEREVTYDLDEIDQLTLPYAATVHKPQGSEYLVVVSPFTRSTS
jgi:exodeoxyribonuclease V alpha subunit